jgi:hypothetical protein
VITKEAEVHYAKEKYTDTVKIAGLTSAKFPRRPVVVNNLKQQSEILYLHCIRRGNACHILNPPLALSGRVCSNNNAQEVFQFHFFCSLRLEFEGVQPESSSR